MKTDINDNYYMTDLIASLERDIVMERYYPLIDCKGELTAILEQAGVARKDQLADAADEEIRTVLGSRVAALFARYIHIYDFRKSKLRQISGYSGTEKYAALAALLRLPGVGLLRAELYCNSAVTLEILAEQSTEDIRSRVSNYIRRENRPETLPQPKEVNCHRAVAKMILHTAKSLP